MQHRRGGGAPAHARLHRRHRLRPGRPPREVEGEQSDTAGVHVDAFAVGHRRLGKIGVLLVDGLRRNGRVQLAFPANAPGVEVDVVQDPAMLVGRRRDAGSRRAARSRSGRGIREPASVAGQGVSTLTTVVTNTWSPQTIGELHDRPGTVSLHTTFCVRLQLAGSEGWSGATPLRVPRNCGQFSAVTGTTGRHASTTIQARRFIAERITGPRA